MTSTCSDRDGSVIQRTCVITENVEMAESTFRVRIDAPEIANKIRPGQFVMIRIAGVNAPLIGRAYAAYDVVFDVDGSPRFLDLVYLRKGALSEPLSRMPPGGQVTLWGPLGNRFDDSPCDVLIAAVGGIGQTPMRLLGRDALQRGYAGAIAMIYGARRKSLLAGVEDFRREGFEVDVCTDDGSAGHHGRVPDLLDPRIQQCVADGKSVRVVTCGPEIMMQKVAQCCERHGVACQVSMETPMACGIGICFSCVAKVRQSDGRWDYKRTCVEGPIFDAAEIVW